MYSVTHISKRLRIVVVSIAAVAIVVFSDGYTASDAALLQTYPTTKTSDGLRTVTVENEEGRVTVKIPDDIRTGDKISGTIVTEPKGVTKEEQDANLAAMRKRRLRLMLAKASGATDTGSTNEPVVLSVPLATGQTSTVKTEAKQGNTLRIEFTASGPVTLAADDSGIKELGRALIPVDLVESAQTKPEPTPKMPVKKTPGLSFVSFADYDTLGADQQTPQFEIPALGQTGRPIDIRGQFDGDSSNTNVSVEVLNVNLPVETIAESPRRSIVANPTNLIGPGRITINEGGSTHSAPFRNIGVGLSAPKTSLMRGEKTEMRIEVTGLAGITQSVPMTLSSSGVVTMSGGPFQQINIRPNDVSPGGAYVTTRSITGVQAGGWGAVATVIVREFDITVQDDADPRLRLMWNSFTGDYRVTGNKPGEVVTGKGKVSAKDCVFQLTLDMANRKINGRADRCTRSATADLIIFVTPRTMIIDSNTDDNLSP
ncbi:MAG: hypothetical protein ABL952_04275 [Pyrinomonadaceae bacterium]